VVVSRTSHPETARLPDGVEMLAGDLADVADVEAAVRGVDRVFLLTGGPDIALHDANVAFAAADAGATHVVKLSSGRTGDDTATDPIPSRRRLGEQAVRDSGVPWTIPGRSDS